MFEQNYIMSVLFQWNDLKLGFCPSCKHFFEHFSEAKALSIILALNKNKNIFFIKRK